MVTSILLNCANWQMHAGLK